MSKPSSTGLLTFMEQQYEQARRQIMDNLPVLPDNIAEFTRPALIKELDHVRLWKRSLNMQNNPNIQTLDAIDYLEQQELTLMVLLQKSIQTVQGQLNLTERARALMGDFVDEAWALFIPFAEDTHFEQFEEMMLAEGGLSLANNIYIRFTNGRQIVIYADEGGSIMPFPNDYVRRRAEDRGLQDEDMPNLFQQIRSIKRT